MVPPFSPLLFLSWKLTCNMLRKYSSVLFSNQVIILSILEIIFVQKQWENMEMMCAFFSLFFCRTCEGIFQPILFIFSLQRPVISTFQKLTPDHSYYCIAANRSIRCPIKLFKWLHSKKKCYHDRSMVGDRSTFRLSAA